MDDPYEWRTPEDLRAMFNALGIVERVESGELRAIIDQNKLRHPHWSSEPLYRQIVRFYDGDRLSAVVNQWQRLDGTLAAGGRQDPKMIRLGDKQYWTRVRRK
jgi:hypothetical protein